MYDILNNVLIAHLKKTQDYFYNDPTIARYFYSKSSASFTIFSCYFLFAGSRLGYCFKFFAPRNACVIIYLDIGLRSLHPYAQLSFSYIYPSRLFL